ncbi:MAG: T9SS type A sorting domain-containing protein [Bacteroidetes bacterium]|nr:MAG: T9SS type A sorting domain-containing protein [Bacteroidota bacterium]
MKKLFLLIAIGFWTNSLQAQNLLAIPDTMNGTSFSLDIIDTSHVFYPGFSTHTFGVNASYLGPTLILNKGDSVNIMVNNRLMDTTTIHWHGLHVSPQNDGGPHIFIPPSTTWNPSLVVRNNAATYWYHPHMHMMTNLHATLGAAGLIIIRDSVESALNLPRTYGEDDFPLVVQSKSFDANKEIIIGDAYDSTMMVNGTVNAYLPVPAQVNRFRILNASTERNYNFGLQGNLVFQQIASDGGLLDAPVPLTRLVLSPGERAEILVDFSGMNGQSIDLMSFASEFPVAMYGSVQPGMGAGLTIPGYTSNMLNGSDFKVMNFQIVAPTPNPVTSIPSVLTTNTPWPIGSAMATKTLTITPSVMGPTALQNPFLINNTSYDMMVMNYSIPLDNIEIWTLTNSSPIAHPFHIHNVHFYVTEINGAAPPPNKQGLKDVILVPAQQTVKFITKFEDFCDPMYPYMYHCHMLTHEDDGMMGQFLVTCPTTEISERDILINSISTFPNPSNDRIQIKNNSHEKIKSIKVYTLQGKCIANYQSLGNVEINIDLTSFSGGTYLLEIEAGKHRIHKKINYIN